VAAYAVIDFEMDTVVIAETAISVIAEMVISVSVRAATLALEAGYEGRNANYQTAPG